MLDITNGELMPVYFISVTGGYINIDQIKKMEDIKGGGVRVTLSDESRNMPTISGDLNCEDFLKRISAVYAIKVK